MAQDTHSTAIKQRFESELLSLIAKQDWPIPVAVLLSSVMMSMLAQDRAPRWLLVGWPLAVAVQLSVRQVVTSWLAAARLSLRNRLALSTVLSAYGGLTHGASLLFWPYLSDLERTVFSMFVLGLSSGAVAAVMGYLPMYLAYITPMMAPLAYAWVSTLSARAGSQWGWAMAMLFAIYCSFLAVLARDTFRHYCDSHESRYRMRLALDDAQAANQAKTRFLASASHDLRQPMHTLTLFGAALSMAPLDEGTQRITRQMNVALQALGSQLDALLDVSKLDAGIVPVRPSPVRVLRFLARVGDGLREAASRKGLNLTVDAPFDLLMEVDEMLLERVVRNLGDNAVKYTRFGQITLGAALHKGQVAIWVQDTGIGIASEEHEKVFEEFYQLGNPERDREQGLGLGLAIVKRLALLMGLPIEMASEPGRGTRFTLLIPQASPVGLSPEPEPIPALTDIAGLRVLVIDDEESVREGMATLLSSLGCVPLLASNIAGALAVVAVSNVDVVLSDLRLRGREDGIEAIRRLREVHPGLPALLVSGDTAPQRLRDADAAALTMLHKPVPVGVLTRAIRAQISQVSAGQ